MLLLSTQCVWLVASLLLIATAATATTTETYRLCMAT
jgi:hypothetical protein